MADMKKTILKLLIVAVAIMATCCKNHSDANFTVTGEIENVEDNYLILLFKSNVDDSTTHIAEDTLRNGCFEFTAPAETGVLYHIFAPHTGVFPSMSVDFYVEPGAEIKITGKDYLTKNWTVKSDVRNQKTYQSYFGEVAGLFKELQILELQCRKEGRSIDYLDLSKPYQEKIDSIEVVWLRNQKRISEPWMDMMLQSIKFSKFYKKTVISFLTKRKCMTLTEGSVLYPNSKTRSCFYISAVIPANHVLKQRRNWTGLSVQVKVR